LSVDSKPRAVHGTGAAERDPRDSAGLLPGRLTALPALLFLPFMLTSFPLLLFGYQSAASAPTFRPAVKAARPRPAWRAPDAVTARRRPAEHAG
jgi:hypothetical protein